MSVISIDQLPFSVIAHELVGSEHGAGVCLIFVEAPPGKEVGLHSHPYEELLIVQEGRGMFSLDGEEIEAGAGEIVIVPAGVAHGFANTRRRPAQAARHPRQPVLLARTG